MTQSQLGCQLRYRRPEHNTVTHNLNIKVGSMQTTKSFEVSLQGALPSVDLDPILQRCSLLCSSSSSGRFHWREIAFEADRTHPNIAAYSSNPASARSLDVKLICRKDISVAGSSESPWQVRVNALKPRSNHIGNRSGYFMLFRRSRKLLNGRLRSARR